MNSSSSTPANQALAPVAAQDRVFAWRDHASLWFSLGVGLLVMQMGAYLLPALSPAQALMAITLGSLIGAGLLGWVGKLGCDSGLSSAGLMHSVYGRHFARLPILLNIIQLLGWGSFELVVMRDATVALGSQSGALTATYWPWLATLFWGSVILLLMSGSMVTLVRLAFGVNAVELMQNAPAVRWDAVIIWLLGIGFYHLLPLVTTATGSALPTLVLTFIVAAATRQMQLRGKPVQV